MDLRCCVLDSLYRDELIVCNYAEPSGRGAAVVKNAKGGSGPAFTFAAAGVLPPRSATDVLLTFEPKDKCGVYEADLAPLV